MVVLKPYRSKAPKNTWQKEGLKLFQWFVHCDLCIFCVPYIPVSWPCSFGTQTCCVCSSVLCCNCPSFLLTCTPQGKLQTGRGQLLLPLLLLWCPDYAASQHRRQQCGSHCSPDCNHFNVHILSVWWGIVWRVSILANHCRLSVFFNNNHIKLLQLAHSYKYTKTDVEGEEEELRD